jgi:hypothetical protein
MNLETRLYPKLVTNFCLSGKILAFQQTLFPCHSPSRLYPFLRNAKANAESLLDGSLTFSILLRISDGKYSISSTHSWSHHKFYVVAVLNLAIGNLSGIKRTFSTRNTEKCFRIVVCPPNTNSATKAIAVC